MRLPLLLAVVSLSAFAENTDAPVSLTASDGTGLKLTKLQARAVVMDPLAFTELTLSFENPLDRVIEGQFKVTLPPGATVSRFAMKLDGRWQEGEVVERQAARRAYEDFLHRRQDPALLEQSGGNEFTAKVFPIPARGVKEVVLSYSHELVASTALYTLPLKGLPEVGELDVKVEGVLGEGVLNKKRFVPSADFLAPPKRNQLGVRSGDLVAARITPVEDVGADALVPFTVLVDSSGSRALGWSEQVRLVQQLLAALAKQTPTLQVNVVAFDQEVAPIYSGLAAGFGDTQARLLRARRALGASNVELALKHVQANPTPRVLLISDGVMTAGSIEGPNLIAQLLKLKAASVQRLDAITVGGLRDEAALARLTTGSLPRDGAVLDGGLAPVELARRLSLATKSKLAVKVEGATAVWPTTLSGVQAGDAVLVYAQLAANAPFKVSINGKSLPLSDGQLVSIERPLLERAWAKARIDSLQAQLDQADGAPQRTQLKNEIIDISTKNRVLSSLTALLVLETEADYARFNIDRRALSDILTVAGGQVIRQKRGPESLAVAKQAPPPKADIAKPKPSSSPEKKMKARARDDEGGASADESANSQGAIEDPKVSERKEEPSPPQAEIAAAPAPPPAEAPRAPPPPSAMRMERRPEPMPNSSSSTRAAIPEKGPDPYTGKFKEVMDGLKSNPTQALALAHGWHEEQPGDLLALVALGEALEKTGDLTTAARAYGSIIDLFPARADLRRFAGVRLERLTTGLELAADSFARAAEQRADHPASHRMLAFALLRAGKHERAFEAISVGIKQRYPDGRFLGVDRILREDAGLVAAAWSKAEPKRRAEISQKLKAIGGIAETGPSLRFVLNWETDANDVDFHIYDGKGGHAYYSSKVLPSGGELYADVTTGYGPECFTIRLPKGKRAFPYTLQAHYYSIGPMGAGMGKLEIIEHDGEGTLRFEQRPYVVMVNQAYVDLGVVKQ
ncbi:MAG: VIT domain-containing protein [Archangium sp.]|nr:VIT domain-containing protein [Archangium sp.]MDP3574683.1 VIT domain-containing protein [Archangium sp.]